jgi:hypothetical protein
MEGWLAPGGLQQQVKGNALICSCNNLKIFLELFQTPILFSKSVFACKIMFFQQSSFFFFFFFNGIILLMRSTGVLQCTLELVLPGAAGFL